MRQTLRVMAACLLVLSLAPACASRSRTIQMEERVQYPVDEQTQQASKPLVVEKETTTTTTTTTDHGSRGILSTAVHIVGEILALPFRLIGGLLRLLF